MPGLPVVFAAIAAVLLGIGAVVQHRAASRTGTGEGRFDIALLLRLFRQPLWLAGFGMTLAHFSLQATALAKGRLVVVEPILSTGLLIALPLAAAVGRGRMRRLDWIAAVAAAGGIAAFLVLANPATGHSRVGTERLAEVVLSLEVVAVVVVVVSVRWVGRMLPLAFGAAAGVMASATDASTKTVADLAGSHHFGVFGDPRIYLLAVAGLTAFTVQQNAYGNGGLAGSLPALAVLQPATGVALGVLLYGENVNAGAGHLAGEVIAAVVALTGIVTLARSPLAQLMHPGRARSAPLLVETGAKR